MGNLKEHFPTLEGMLFDEDKVVTYKLLSKELKVHVNIAKEILREFWESKSNHDDLDATFLIYGKQSAGGGVRVEIVSSEKLEDAKGKFQEVSFHFYSLQKPRKDLNLLDNQEYDVKYSAVRMEGEILKRQTEFKKKETVAVPEQPKSSNSATTATSSAKPVVKKSPEKKSPPPKEDKGSGKLDRKKSSSVLKGKPEQTRGMGSFLMKGSEAKEMKERKEKEAKEEKELAEKKKKEAEESNSKKAKETFKKKDKKATNNNKRKKNDTSREEETKKRRRVFVESSDEDETLEEMKEQLEDEEPVVEMEISPPSKASEEDEKIQEAKKRGRKIIVKTVDEMYKDEDGFLVTKKVKVYESCSDNDEPVKLEKPLEQKPKKPAFTEAKETKGPGKRGAKKSTGKQMTLTSFFKK